MSQHGLIEKNSKARNYAVLLNAMCSVGSWTERKFIMFCCCRWPCTHWDVIANIQSDPSLLRKSMGYISAVSRMVFVMRLPHIFFTPKRAYCNSFVVFRIRRFCFKLSHCLYAFTVSYSSLPENSPSEESDERAWVISSAWNATTLLDISVVSLRKPIYSK